MDIGAFTPFLHWLREREYINDIIQEICGARLTYNYLRICGVSQDLPDGVADKILRWIDHFVPITGEFDRLISNNEIFVRRLAGVAAVRAEDAIDFGLVGPNLRASAVYWDLQRDMSYSAYADFQFDVPLGQGFRGSVGDCYDRFVVRILEMRESCRIIRQALAKMPAGEIRVKVPKKLKVPDVRVARVAEEAREPRGADARVDDADAERDVVEERRELARRALRRVHAEEDVLTQRRADDARRLHGRNALAHGPRIPREPRGFPEPTRQVNCTGDG